MNDYKLIIGENYKDRGKKEVVNNESEKIINYNILHEALYSKVIILNLDEKTIGIINEFKNYLPKNKRSMWDYIPRYNKKKSSKEIYDNSFIKKNNFNLDLSGENKALEIIDEYLINTSYNHLTNCGVSVKKEGVIEYRSYNLTNDENDQIFFDVYKDDETSDYKVETCIYILQDNEKNIYGNLDFYMISQSSPQSPSKLNDASTNNISKKEIKIFNNLLVMISGNILYCPQPLYGNGNRIVIIVKMRSNRI